MARGPALTEMDKLDTKNRLMQACEKSWARQGYKKTNIKELCAKVGIGIGTFYMLYPTKEDLFIETLEEIQFALNRRFFDEILEHDPSKQGFAKSLKGLYKEYSELPFLYQTNSADFISFSNKLPKEKMDRLKFDNVEFFQKAIDRAGLRLKTSKEIAFGVLSALLSTISIKDTLTSFSCDNYALFDFMLEKLIDEIFDAP